MNFVESSVINSRIKVDSAEFFGIDHTSIIKASLDITLSDRSYTPKDNDLRSDWVASVAAPAFNILASEGVRADKFCTIGTGAGLDALAAIEILQSSSVFVTDLHEEVVARAVENITSNIEHGAVSVRHATGDLLTPVSMNAFRTEVLYENLPNIPLSGELDLGRGQNSSTFISDRTEALPDFVSNYLLALHYVVLQNATSVVLPAGRILSSIGGRVPLRMILQLAASAGYSGRILLYTWKQQSEPEDVIGGYAHWESSGYGPFTFYPLPVLERAFSKGAVSGDAAAKAREAELQPYALSAAQALHMFRSGMPIGHTVGVLESTWPRIENEVV